MEARLLHDLVGASARRDPEAVAVVDGDRTLTYGELDAASGRLSGLLVAAGVRRGDRVGVHAEKSLESVVALYGACRGVRVLGSPALAMAYIACGRLDGMAQRDADVLLQWIARGAAGHAS